jgi:hypothetical protein
MRYGQLLEMLERFLALSGIPKLRKEYQRIFPNYWAKFLVHPENVGWLCKYAIKRSNGLPVGTLKLAHLGDLGSGIIFHGVYASFWRPYLIIFVQKLGFIIPIWGLQDSPDVGIKEVETVVEVCDDI